MVWQKTLFICLSLVFANASISGQESNIPADGFDNVYRDIPLGFQTSDVPLDPDETETFVAVNDSIPANPDDFDPADDADNTRVYYETNPSDGNEHSFTPDISQAQNMAVEDRQYSNNYDKDSSVQPVLEGKEVDLPGNKPMNRHGYGGDSHTEGIHEHKHKNLTRNNYEKDYSVQPVLQGKAVDLSGNKPMNRNGYDGGSLTEGIHEHKHQNLTRNDLASQQDMVLQEGNMQVEGKVLQTKFKGDCKALGLMFENGYVKIDSSSFKPLPKSDMTFVARIRVRNTEIITTIYSTAAANGGKQVLEVRPSTGKNINAHLKWTVKTDSSKTLFSVETEDIIPSGMWTHVVAKYDGKQGRSYLFVNGEKVTKLKGVAKSTNLPWGNTVVIGGQVNEENKVTFPYKGGMVGIRFVEKPLTDAEIVSEFNSCELENGAEPYLVTVCSGSKLTHGTSSRVFIKIYGENSQFGETKIGSKFKSGCSKTLTIYGPAVGKIDKISVRKDTSGVIGKTWRLAKVTIAGGSSGKLTDVYTFDCNNCKFSEKKGEVLQHFIEAKPEVNGGWSAWSDWSGCGSGMCGGDKKVRTRACTNPEPSDGGKMCSLQDGSIIAGIDSQVELCQVDGGWGSWSGWSDCQKPCGGSTVKRTRKCDNPATGNGGKPCSGPDSETKQDCIEPCEDWPVHGDWAEWSQWSACSKTCGGGTVTRKRTCTNPAPLRGGSPCEGDDTETATDCTQHCPIDGGWDEWSPWTDCSTTCGPGQQTRERECTKPPPAYGGKTCPGQPKETQNCKIVDCPNAENGKWGDWGPWSACSETQFCDQGEKTRTRKCDSPAPSNGGELCEGLDTEEEICPKDNCKPINGDTIEVKPTSFITESCNAKTADFAGGSKASHIPPSIFEKPAISDVLKTSYFSKTTETHNGQELTKFCFQPSSPLTIEMLDKVIPGYDKSPSLPKFTKPAPTEKTAGLSVLLNHDGTFYATEFSLGDSREYSPLKDKKIRKARFFYREKSDKQEIIGYGKHTFVDDVDLDVEVKPGPVIAGELLNSKTDLDTIVKKLSLPQASALAGTPTATIQEKLLNALLDYLAQLGLSKIPISSMSEVVNKDTQRVSGSLATSDQKDLFYLEIVKQKNFAVGVTSDKASFQNFMDKLLSKLNKKPSSFELFGDMADASVGIAYAQKGFTVARETSFQREPLKSGFGSKITEGVFIAARMRIPQTCQSNACKVAQVILGKDSWLILTGNANLKSMKLKASVLDRKINEKFTLSNIDFYVQVGFKPPRATVGFNINLVMAVEGDVFKDNVKKENSELTFGGNFELTSSLDISVSLSMSGVWRNAFGLSFLSFQDLYLSFSISAVSGIPTKLAVGGVALLGKDCYSQEDFQKDGSCIKGTVDLSLTPNPANQYVYGELSAVTIGKVLRMLGSKIDLPKKISDMGFPKTVVLSLAWADQEITYLKTPRKIKKGLYISGDVNLFGFTTAVEIQVNSDVIFFQALLSPIELPGGVMLVRSLDDKKNGPKFYVKATKSPLSAEIFLQGALKILGVETEIQFIFKMTFIEATLKLKLPVGGLQADLYVKGGFGGSLKDSGITVKAKITTASDKAKVQQDVSKDIEASVNKARGALQSAKDKIREQKEKCMKETTSYCQLCEDITCKKITAGCEAALDHLKNFIGGTANKFGGWFVGVSKKISKQFKKEKERRSVEFFPGRHQMATRIRRKRFIGRFLCKSLAPAICKGSKIFCEGSCSLSKHITKGVCKGLDLAHKSMYLVENSFHWVKRVYDIIPKELFILHGISFEVAFSPSLQNKVEASIDITVMNVRRQLSLEISLASIVEMGKAIMNKAIADLKKMFSVRHQEPSYDKPNNAGDVILSAPFRIKSNGNKMCIRSPTMDKNVPLSTGACASEDTLWIYTLTGELMNTYSVLCMAVDGQGNKMQLVQQECKINAQNQKLYCDMNRIHVDEAKTQCLVEKGSSITVEPCTVEPTDETKEFVVPANEEWVVDQDPRRKVCDNFVQDLALNKPAKQISTFNPKDLDKEELAALDANEQQALTKVGPELAVNGDMSNSLREGSCSHTALSTDPWWKVDLLSEHIITDVTIQTAFEGAKVSGLDRFEIRVGLLEEFQKNPMCGPRVIKGAHLGELWTSTCSPPLPGRYVSVQRFGENYLTLCEVAVYARKDNQGKCSDELRRRRSIIRSVSHEERVLKRARITYGRYD